MDYLEACKETLAARLLDELVELGVIPCSIYTKLLYPDWEDIWDADESTRPRTE